MPSDDEGGDDLSVDLSDLSISEPDLDGFHDGLEAHANEPSSWDQVRPRGGDLFCCSGRVRKGRFRNTKSREQ